MDWEEYQEKGKKYARIRKLELLSNMSPIIGDPKDLELYSEQFICMLYQLSNRTTFRSRNADDVFKKLKLGGFHDITGTTDEIVQYLVERGHIKFGSGSQVILTQEGKIWCDSHCKSHLQRFNFGGDNE